MHNSTTDSTTWTLQHPDGHVVSFKVVKNGNVIITNDKRSFGCIVEKARKYWREYISRGFFVSNKCVNHDMDKFYDYKRKEEQDWDYKNSTYTVPKNIEDYLKDYMSDIPNAELQEARINPKDFYKKMKNYALEA